MATAEREFRLPVAFLHGKLHSYPTIGTAFCEIETSGRLHGVGLYIMYGFAALVESWFKERPACVYVAAHMLRRYSSTKLWRPKAVETAKLFVRRGLCS